MDLPLPNLKIQGFLLPLKPTSVIAPIMRSVASEPNCRERCWL